MHSTALAALTLLAGAAPLLAAPRESFFMGGATSNGLYQSPLNHVRTFTFTGIHNGSAYQARHLLISGRVTRNFTFSAPTEAAVMITPPGGSPFIARIFQTNGATEEVIDHAVVPVSGFTTAGTWTFRFFETSDHATSVTTPDSSWDYFIVKLEDGAPPTGAIPGPNLNATLSNVHVDGGAANPPLYAFIMPAGVPVGVARLSGLGTARAANTVPSMGSNALLRARLQLVAPDGTIFTQGAPWTTGSRSSAEGSAMVYAPRPVNPAGLWVVRAWDTEDQPGIDSTISTLTVSTFPPVMTPIPITVGGPWSSASKTIAAPGEIAWFTFTAPADLDASGAIDIDVLGTSLTPLNDTDIALYDADGRWLNGDDNNGPGALSQLSFGTRLARRAPIGDGEPFRGQNGNIGGGSFDLRPGQTHYLAVAGGTDATHNSLMRSAGGANTGTVTARARVFRFDAPSDPVPPPPVFVDLGVIGTPDLGQHVVETFTDTIDGLDPTTPIRWFRFVTRQALTTVGGTYLDIDTEGTQPAVTTIATRSLQDTQIAVFSRAGIPFASDDDDGSNQRSLLSFGASTPVRPALVTGGSPAGAPRSGQDTPTGGMQPGVYYLALSNYQSTFGFDFAAQTDNTIGFGDRILNFRTNLCTGPASCGIADLAGPGQTPGPDNQLTADDIIVFITYFFTADARADLAGPGQSIGADGQFTADDIIVFIGAFFAGC